MTIFSFPTTPRNLESENSRQAHAGLGTSNLTGQVPEKANHTAEEQNSADHRHPLEVTSRDLFIMFQELLHATRGSQSGRPSSNLRVDLPKYFGRPGESITMWLFQLNDVFESRGVYGLDRLPYLSTCLGEAALSWLHNWHLNIRAGMCPQSRRGKKSKCQSKLPSSHRVTNSSCETSYGHFARHHRPRLTRTRSELSLDKSWTCMRRTRSTTMSMA